MKKRTLFTTILFTFLLNIGISQTVTPYYSGWDDASQEDGWTQFRLGNENPFYEWELSTVEKFSGTKGLIHNYPVGGTEAVDDWFVSPGFDLSSGGRIDSLRYLYAGFGTPVEGDTIQIVLLEGNQNPNLATSETVLYSFTDSSYVIDGIWKKIENITVPATSGMAYIGFKYFTTDNWLDVRFDNFSLSNNAIIGIEKKNEADLSIFPTPNQGILNFKGLTADKYAISIYNTIGEIVFEQDFNNGNSIVTSLTDGIYYIEIKEENERPFYKKIIICHE